MGVEFFCDPLWKGPKPRAGTILRVCPMGGKEIRGRVPVEIVIRPYPVPNRAER